MTTQRAHIVGHRLANGLSEEMTSMAPERTSNATHPIVGGSVDEIAQPKTQRDSTEIKKSPMRTIQSSQATRLVAVLRFWLWVMAPCNGLLACLLSWYCFHFSTASTHLGICVMAAITIAAITANNAWEALNTARISSISTEPAVAVSAQQS